MIIFASFVIKFHAFRITENKNECSVLKINVLSVLAHECTRCEILSYLQFNFYFHVFFSSIYSMQ